ncbi:murein hydrolase activator EnvC family protein [Defluviitalea saccharophila]|uniref:Peptidoglycan DD-metalloendopeptidase family protein n=1 Tax=Defluviitalea saccharophila TaxID=879970 RepID=A0ABZ2Y0F9_9FIRM|nr:peptidoglycan DD-metalloendopeptidase family protein [Candidatus Epulonipiscium sp.]
MYKVIKRGIILLFVIILGCGPFFSVAADSLKEKKNKLEDVQKNLKNAKEKLKKTKEEKENIMQNIEALDSDLAKVDEYLEEINGQLEELEAEVQQKEEELIKAEEERQAQYEAFKERFKYMYMNKRVGYMQVLLHSKDFSDFLNRADVISKIVEYDQNLIKEMKENEAKIEEQKKELENKKEEVTLVKKHQLGVKHSIEEAMKEKETLIAQLSDDEVAYMELIKEEEEISKQLEKEIKELTRKSTRIYSGGKFEWPVPGYYTLSSNYGGRTDPVYGGYAFHNGIDIPAPKGTNVIAAADGEVIVSGYVNGYGYTIIIDHGSGLTTLYGHNSQLVASVGQFVQRGQVVAKVGSTGKSTGNHSHFEVRVNGSHTNPIPYLSK